MLNFPKPTVFIYSGQGSQYYQMGIDLYQRHCRFKYWLDYCDSVFKPLIAKSIVEVLYSTGSKTDNFDRLLDTNAALLSIQYSLSQVLKEMDINPDILLGYSLGEYLSAVVSGALTFEEGAWLLANYAKLLENKSETFGEMLSIFDSPDVLNQLSNSPFDCEIVGHFFERNFVVSGKQDVIGQMQKSLRKAKVVTQKLPVSFAFHTDCMDSVKEQYYRLGERISFVSPKVRAVSCLTTNEVDQFSIDHLWSATRYKILFGQTIKNLLNQGHFNFIDLGPSGTSATYIKNHLAINNQLSIEGGSAAFFILNPFGRDFESLNKLDTLLSIQNLSVEAKLKTIG